MRLYITRILLLGILASSTLLDARRTKISNHVSGETLSILVRYIKDDQRSDDSIDEGHMEFKLETGRSIKLGNNYSIHTISAKTADDHHEMRFQYLQDNHISYYNENNKICVQVETFSCLAPDTPGDRNHVFEN